MTPIPESRSLLRRWTAPLQGWRGRLLGFAVLTAVGSALGLMAVTSAGAPVDPVGAHPGVVSAAVRHGDPPLGVDGFLDLERRLAEERRSRVQGMLDRLWPDRAFVTVGVELDPRWVSSEERIQPEQPALIEDERGSGAGGSRRRSLEPFSGERQVTLLAPEIRRVSAALVLDAAIARDPRQQQRIVDAVKKALGPVRGQDADVEVLVESFAPRDSAAPSRAVVAIDPRPEQDVTVFAASIALSALGVAWFWLHRSRRRRERAATVAEVPPPVPPSEATRARRSAIEQAIQEDPVFASRLVESWMAEGRT
ncbi:MAG: hypothetical protein U1F36_18725 [Planctomycetota bacterium]